MRELWQRIEQYFAIHWPNKELKLRPPATDTQIAAAERELGVRFPDDFRESLLVHNGQDEGPNLLWLPAVCQLGSLESMVKCWKDDRDSFDTSDTECFDWLDSSQRTRQVHFHPKHIPFAGSPFWDYDRLLFDFAPGPMGKPGQIIMRNDIDFVFLCESFRELMQKTADGLEGGTITMSENGPEMSHWVTPEYRSARSKQLMSPFRYFARGASK